MPDRIAFVGGLDARVFETNDKEIIRRVIVSDVDHRHLSIEVPWLSGINPTSENLARHIYTEMAKGLAGVGVRMGHVRVWESPQQSALYRED